MMVIGAVGQRGEKNEKQRRRSDTQLPSVERDYKLDEAVSCKECKWWDHDEDRSDGRHRCELLDNIRFEPEFYCAYGERSEE